MPTELDAAVSAAMTARESGNVDAANEAFDNVRQVAEATYPEEGDEALAPASGEFAMSQESLDQISDILTATGNSDMCDARLSSTVRQAHAYAQEFERSNPTLASQRDRRTRRQRSEGLRQILRSTGAATIFCGPDCKGRCATL
jgi:hypothetical protein